MGVFDKFKDKVKSINTDALKDLAETAKAKVKDVTDKVPDNWQDLADIGSEKIKKISDAIISEAKEFKDTFKSNGNEEKVKVEDEKVEEKKEDFNDEVDSDSDSDSERSKDILDVLVENAAESIKESTTDYIASTAIGKLFGVGKSSSSNYDVDDDYDDDDDDDDFFENYMRSKSKQSSPKSEPHKTIRKVWVCRYVGRHSSAPKILHVPSTNDYIRPSANEIDEALMKLGFDKGTAVSIRGADQDWECT